MKFIPLVLSFFFLQIAIFAQPCPSGNLTFSTQADIDNFATNYPTCTILPATLKIQGSNITNLNGLSQITAINGNCDISGTGSLVNLTGLDNVLSISGHVFISYNDNLETLSGLDNLTSIGGVLFIEENPSLSSLAALHNLSNFNFDLSVYNCDALTDLHGLENITTPSFVIIGQNDNLISIAGLNGVMTNSLSIMGIEDNPLLSVCNEPFICNGLSGPPFLFVTNNAQGCNTIDEINFNCNNPDICPSGSLIINSQQDIADFAADYPDCTQLQGSLIVQNTSLTNLDGLQQLTSVGANVVIKDNLLLDNLTGLENITSIGLSLIFEKNIAASSLTGLNNLAIVGENLKISFANALTDLSGLENLQHLIGSLELSSNTNLANIGAISSLEPTLIYDLIIKDNPLLSTCNIPVICSYLEFGHPHLIANNDSGCNSLNEVVQSCPNGFHCPEGDLVFNSQEEIDLFTTNYPGCTAINGSLYIVGNDIVDLSPLNTITDIAVDLVINYNPNLTTLFGIENLLIEPKNTFITNNNVLTDISVFENIVFPLDKKLTLANNPMLTACDYNSICTYFENSSLGVVFNNAGGCTNELSLLTQCAGDVSCPIGDLVFNNQEEVDQFIIIYPGCTEISGNVILTPNAGIQNLNGLQNIESISGNLVITKNLSSLDLANLQSVGGNVKIENTRLKNLEGLGNLNHVGGYLRIGYNPDLETLHGLESLTMLSKVKIEFNPLLYSLSGLANVTAINGYLKLRSNTALESLNGLANVNPSSLTELEIINNTALVLCNQNNICTYLTSTKPRTIANNSTGCNTEIEMVATCTNNPCGSNNLTLATQEEIDDFPLNYPGCTIWAANLSIQNPEISNLDGLSQLIAIEGDLMIDDTEINSLSGLSNIIEIHGQAIISNNNALASLEGLKTVGAGLSILGNEGLSLCAIESVCQHISMGGFTDIEGNATGCENTAVVETECTALIDICMRVNSSADDAEENAMGSVNLTSSDLEMVMDGAEQIIGLRFINLNLPPNAIIENANIQFTSDQIDNENPCLLHIYGEWSELPLPFQNTPFNISNRTKTTTSIDWSPSDWTQKNEAGPDQRTVDISPVLQEIVNRPGYIQNSPVVILIDGNGKRTADSYDGNPEAAAQLCVAYRENAAAAFENYDQNNKTITNIPRTSLIHAYPNPTRSILHLDLGAYTGEQMLITMYNSLGVPVLTEEWKEISSAPIKLSLGHLPKGMYWVSVNVAGNALENVRVVVE